MITRKYICDSCKLESQTVKGWYIVSDLNKIVQVFMLTSEPNYEYKEDALCCGEECAMKVLSQRIHRLKEEAKNV